MTRATPPQPNCRVVILHNEIPAEAIDADENVLEQASVVRKGLSALGYETATVAVSLNLQQAVEDLARIRPAFVFNLVEPMVGNGLLCYAASALLEHLKMPFTGCPARSHYVTTDKLLTKKLLRLYGIRTPSWACAGEEHGFIAPAHYILKPVAEDASVGVDRESVADIHSLAELRELLRQRAGDIGGPYFAEQYIEGREFTVPVLGSPEGPITLPPAEMTFDGYEKRHWRNILCYRAKWITDSVEYRHLRAHFQFEPEDHALLEEMKQVAVLCWERFCGRGYVRIDFRVDRRGRPYVLEINTNPCLTFYAGGLLDAARVADLELQDVLALIVADL